MPPDIWKIVVPNKGTEPDGWKRSYTYAEFFNSYSIVGPRNIICEVQIEVPIVNYMGPVSDRFATRSSLDAIESAGFELQQLLNAEDPLGMGILSVPETMCRKFTVMMQEKLSISIPGARVIKIGMKY